MAKGSLGLQPAISVVSNTQQEVRFAGRIPGGAKSGLAVINVLAISGWTGAPSIRLYSASDAALDPDLATASGFWFNLGAASAVSTAGVKPVTLTSMAELVRWAVEGGTPGATPVLRFSIDVYAFDA